MKLIDKDAVLAKIDKRIKVLQKHPMENHKTICHLDSVMQSVNSLEVKEVDLDFILHEYWDLSSKITIDCLESATMTKDEMINFAKYFFELGMAVSNKARKGE